MSRLRCGLFRKHDWYRIHSAATGVTRRVCTRCKKAIDSHNGEELAQWKMSAARFLILKWKTRNFRKVKAAR